MSQKTLDLVIKTHFFSEDGICQPCRIQEEFENKVDWEERENELKALLDKYRSSDGSHDCIVPGSGGKDSVFQSMILKREVWNASSNCYMGSHMYTEIGKKNFESWIHKGGFDNFYLLLLEIHKGS